MMNVFYDVKKYRYLDLNYYCHTDITSHFCCRGKPKTSVAAPSYFLKSVESRNQTVTATSITPFFYIYISNQVHRVTSFASFAVRSPFHGYSIEWFCSSLFVFTLPLGQLPQSPHPVSGAIFWANLAVGNPLRRNEFKFTKEGKKICNGLTGSLKYSVWVNCSAGQSVSVNRV